MRFCHARREVLDRVAFTARSNTGSTIVSGSERVMVSKLELFDPLRNRTWIYTIGRRQSHLELPEDMDKFVVPYDQDGNVVTLPGPPALPDLPIGARWLHRSLCRRTAELAAQMNLGVARYWRQSAPLAPVMIRVDDRESRLGL